MLGSRELLRHVVQQRSLVVKRLRVAELGERLQLEAPRAALVRAAISQAAGHQWAINQAAGHQWAISQAAGHAASHLCSSSWLG